MICQNCGLSGHHFMKCYKPRTSFGVILYHYVDNELKLLMIRRKHTIGFIQIIRGKYMRTDSTYLTTLFNVLTNFEVELIKTKPFKDLWEYVWMEKYFNTRTSPHLTTSFVRAREKFNALDRAVFISSRTTNYVDQEWGFPKGKKNPKESNVNTAKRELAEESGIEALDIEMLPKKFEEKYTSYDGLEYNNIYYVAKYTGDAVDFVISNRREQLTEVSDIKFLSINECLDKIRNYSKQKRLLVGKISNFLDRRRNFLV